MKALYLSLALGLSVTTASIAIEQSGKEMGTSEEKMEELDLKLQTPEMRAAHEKTEVAKKIWKGKVKELGLQDEEKKVRKRLLEFYDYKILNLQEKIIFREYDIKILNDLIKSEDMKAKKDYLQLRLDHVTAKNVDYTVGVKSGLEKGEGRIETQKEIIQELTDAINALEKNDPKVANAYFEKKIMSHEKHLKAFEEKIKELKEKAKKLSEEK